MTFKATLCPTAWNKLKPNWISCLINDKLLTQKNFQYDGTKSAYFPIVGSIWTIRHRKQILRLVAKVGSISWCWRAIGCLPQKKKNSISGRVKLECKFFREMCLILHMFLKSTSNKDSLLELCICNMFTTACKGSALPPTDPSQHC